MIQNEINYYLRKNKKYLGDVYFSQPIVDGLTVEDMLKNERNEIEEFEDDYDNNLAIKNFKRNVKNEQHLKILELFSKGVGQMEIAKIIGCSQPQVSRILKKYKQIGGDNLC